MASCPIITGTDPAVPVVVGTMNQVLAYASDSWSITMANIAALNAFHVQPYSFQVSFGMDGELTAFERPDRPADPEGLEFTPDTTMPTLASIQWPTISAGTAPTFHGTAPQIVIPARPQMDIPSVPDAPVLADVVLPPVPTYTLPPVPTLRTIALPTDPNITIPTFTAIAPVRNFDVPTFDFDFTPTPYSSALLDAVKARLSAMLQGGTGLPAAIEQALFDRAVAREDANDARALVEAAEEFSSRGFTEPNGILVRRMAEVRQANRTARSAASRDVLIRATELEIENLRFSVTQGIALETVLIDLHFKTANLLLEAAKFSHEATIRVLDARISILNADTALFQAKASVFRDLLQAELAKLEIFKSQLDAQRLKGELNAQDVQLYEARLRAVDVLFGIYKAQIDGQNAVSANNNARIQGFNGLIQARSETIRAKGFEFDAFKTEVEAEKVKGEIYDVSARAFGAQVQAYAAAENVKIERGQFGIAKGQAQLDEWRARLNGVIEKLRADALVVTTRLDVFRGFLDRYRTDASVEQTAGEANARAFTLMLEREKSSVDAQLRNVQLLIDQNEKIYGLLLEAMRTSATVGAQVAGSALAAANVSASLSSSSGHSQSLEIKGSCG